VVLVVVDVVVVFGFSSFLTSVSGDFSSSSESHLISSS